MRRAFCGVGVEYHFTPTCTSIISRVLIQKSFHYIINLSQPRSHRHFRNSRARLLGFEKTQNTHTQPIRAALPRTLQPATTPERWRRQFRKIISNLLFALVGKTVHAVAE